MKKRKRNIPLQFWVNELEEQKIHSNMEKNGMSNLSEFLRILALSDAKVSFSVSIPNVIAVDEASLDDPLEGKGQQVQAVRVRRVEGDQKRAAG